MPGRIDQVQVVDLSVGCDVAQRGGLGLDRDPALAFQVHRIEHLFRHFAFRQPAAALYQSIGQRRFTVVDVRNDRKVADVLHSNAVARSAGRTAHGWATRILTRKRG